MASNLHVRKLCTGATFTASEAKTFEVKLTDFVGQFNKMSISAVTTSGTVNVTYQVSVNGSDFFSTTSSTGALTNVTTTEQHADVDYDEDMIVQTIKFTVTDTGSTAEGVDIVLLYQ